MKGRNGLIMMVVIIREQIVVTKRASGSSFLKIRGTYLLYLSEKVRAGGENLTDV